MMARVRPVLAVVGLILLTACSSPGRVDQMVALLPVPAEPTEPTLKNGIGIMDVAGGSSTNPLWTSQVSSDAFQRALELSLQNAGLLSKIAAGGKYQLTADLSRLDQPIAGFDMTVSSTVRYSLVEAQSRKEIYSKVIQAPYTATMSDALMGNERLQLANEGAIKKNIEAFIADMMKLDFP